MTEAPASRVLSPRAIADKWAIAAQNGPFEAAKELRETATTWLGFLTVALGALSIGGLAFLPEEIGKLAEGTRDWVLLFLFAAALLGVVARYLATLASQVTPVITYTNGPSLRQLTQQSNFSAATRLIQSQQVASGAIACLLIAAFLSIALPDAEQAKPYRLVHQQNGQTLCGELTSNRDGIVSIKTPNQTTPLSSVTEIVEVASCP